MHKITAHTFLIFSILTAYTPIKTADLLHQHPNPKYLEYTEDAIYPFHEDIMPALGVFMCTYAYFWIFIKGLASASYALTQSANESSFPHAFAFIRNEMQQAGLGNIHINFKTSTLIHDWQLLAGENARHIYVIIPLTALQNLEFIAANLPNSPHLNKYRFISHCLSRQIQNGHLQKKNRPLLKP